MLREVSVGEQTIHRTSPVCSSTAPTAGSSPATHGPPSTDGDDTGGVLATDGRLVGTPVVTLEATVVPGSDGVVVEVSGDDVEVGAKDVPRASAAAGEGASLSPHAPTSTEQPTNTTSGAVNARHRSSDRPNLPPAARSRMEHFTAPSWWNGAGTAALTAISTDGAAIDSHE